MMFEDAKAVDFIDNEWVLTGERALDDILDIRKQALMLWGRSESLDKLISYEEFLIVNDLDDKFYYKSHYDLMKHVLFMYSMKDAGCWELSWDIFPTADIDLYPIQLTVLKLEEIDHNAMASLVSELGLFKSTKDAKRSGWGKPITKGDHFFKKKTYILRIT